MGKRFFSSLQYPDWLLVQPSFYIQGPESPSLGMKFMTHLYGVKAKKDISAPP
jgi:hypothetical protein